MPGWVNSLLKLISNSSSYVDIDCDEKTSNQPPFQITVILTVSSLTCITTTSWDYNTLITPSYFLIFFNVIPVKSLVLF